MSAPSPSAAVDRRAAAWAFGVLAVFVVGLLSSCGTPVPPVAASSEVVVVKPEPTVTPTPVPPTPLPEPAISPTPEPTPTVAPVRGVTDDTIQLATIVDIQTNGAADGLYTPVFQGAQAWATAVNRGGGIANREVQLVLIDSSLLHHDLAIEQACSGDFFALVGSKSLNDGPGMESLNEDQCDLLDFPAAAQSPERRASPATFVTNAFLDPFFQAGPLQWLAEEFPDAIESTSIPRVEFPTSLLLAEHMAEVASVTGYGIVDESLVRTNDDFDALIVDMRDKDVQTLLWTGDSSRLVTLLSAADQDSFSFDIVLCDASCHSDRFLAAAGDSAEGIYSWIPHLPFDEAINTPDLVKYDFHSRGLLGYDGAASEGVEAWVAGRLFEEAVKLATGAGTVDYDPDALNRASVLAAAQTIDSWDAVGTFGETNPSLAIPSACFVLMQVNDGNWERVWPEEDASRDCDAENLYRLSNPDFGIESTSSTSSDAIFAEPATTDDEEQVDVVESTEQIDKFDTEFQQEAPNG